MRWGGDHLNALGVPNFLIVKEILCVIGGEHIEESIHVIAVDLMLQRWK